MAHKTLIGGTAYKIRGGKALVNSTAYEIKNGKTIVGGTAYEIAFTPTITITGVGNTIIVNWAIAIVYGEYHTEATTLTLPVGTIITCLASTDKYSTSSIKLNGQIVAQATGSGSGIGGVINNTAKYLYTVVGDATIALAYTKTADGHYYGSIEITEH